MLVQCCQKWSWSLPQIVCKVTPSICLQPLQRGAFQWERRRRELEVSLYQAKQEPDWIKQRKTNSEHCERAAPGSAGTHLETAWEMEGALLGKTGGKNCLTLLVFSRSWRRHFVLWPRKNAWEVAERWIGNGTKIKSSWKILKKTHSSDHQLEIFYFFHFLQFFLYFLEGISFSFFKCWE